MSASRGHAYRGRFAPSPTGPLHAGSMLAALGSWLLARQAGGEWLLRIEDIDPPREVAGAALDQLRTLQAFGLRHDGGIAFQRQRGHLYRAAIEGTSCNLVLGAMRLQRLGITIGEVRLCGGASKNAFWRQVERPAASASRRRR